MSSASRAEANRPSRVLVLICVVFAALAISYALATDLKGGPDETAHFIYIRSLAVRHVLPDVSPVPVNSIDSTTSHEAHQPPLYYAVMAVPYAILHGLGASTDAIWRILRILGIVFGVAWVCSVYHLARTVLGTERSGLGVAAFVALIPTGAYMAGVLNNDTMISMWFGWALVLMVRFLKQGALERRCAIWLGAIIGAAILTKAQGALLVPVFLLAALMALLYGQPRDLKAVAGAAGTVLLTAVVVSGWWLARSLWVYGTIQPDLLHNPLLAQQGSAQFWCVSTYGYFWTPFWLIQPFVNGGAYINTLLLLSALPVIGLLVRILGIRDLDARSLGLLLVTAGVVFATWFDYMLTVDSGVKLQGRLFLPVAPVVGIVAVAGSQLWLKGRVKTVAAVLVYGGMVTANLLVLRCVLAYYALGYGG